MDCDEMKIALLLALIFFSDTRGRTASTAFFVAPNGRDTNPGTERRPLATLERARDELRKLKKKGSLRSREVTVWIRGGTYPLKKTFELAAEDSGTSGAPILYRAFKQEQPRLIGGIEFSLADFHRVTDRTVLSRLEESARTNVLQIDLRKFGVSDFGVAWPDRFRGYNGWPELFFDGKPMHPARWPNTGFRSEERR